MTSNQRKAIVLVSGGLDSATALAIAMRDGFTCNALSFDYGQRHRVELDAARRISAAMGVVEHRTVQIDLRAFGGSALTDDAIDVPKRETPSLEPGGQEVGEDPSDIPATYVPARNTVFLSYALAYAEVIDARHIFIGVNAVDYSGYPDCRPAFIEAFEAMANLATKTGVEATTDDQRIRIHAPLINMTKAEIIQTGTKLGVDYSLTVSCYDPGVHRKPCGACDSCRLRAAGFSEAGLPDPATIVTA